MSEQKELVKAIETLLKDEVLNREFLDDAGDLEDFYQQMLTLGVARKEDYNVVSTGEISKLSVTFLVR